MFNLKPYATTLMDEIHGWEEEEKKGWDPNSQHE